MNLFFDLDGTLADSAPGITRCLQHALAALGRQAPPAERLWGCIGRNIRGVLAELLATEDREMIECAMVRYRERFTTVGIFENALYPGVEGMLDELGAAGHRLWVVTAKPEVFARKIVDYFGLTALFRAVYGSELSGRNSDKTELLAEVLEREALEPAGCLMIGDRATDVRAGRANGTRTVGVLWGYGSEQELRSAGPDCLVESVPALAARVEACFSDSRP